MKKTLIIIVLFLIFLPPLILVTLLLYCKYYTYGRTYQATLDRIGWQMTFTEQNADTILNFTFSNMRINQQDRLSLLTRNSNTHNVVSFVLVEEVDSVFIRKELEFRDLFPPEEQKNNLKNPEWFQVSKDPIIGGIPLGFRSISYSDSSFFSYDRKMHDYIPKSNKIHVVTLYHETERGNAYYLWDETKNDTVGVKLFVLVD